MMKTRFHIDLKTLLILLCQLYIVNCQIVQGCSKNYF